MRGRGTIRFESEDKLEGPLRAVGGVGGAGSTSVNYIPHQKLIGVPKDSNFEPDYFLADNGIRFFLR